MDGGPSTPAIPVEFPLRGEWAAANTPAERVPSHGTDQLGQRYAYDFMRIDRARRGWKFYRSCGSIRVAPGEQVRTGQQLAQVGHSGNSTAPHLHFHLMDGPNILTAKGLPCCFKEYEVLRDGVWVRTRDGLPGKREFVRDCAV